MTETERLKKIKAALAAASTKTVEAKGFLEDAALATADGPAPEKAVRILVLKAELDRLGRRILEVSKS